MRGKAPRDALAAALCVSKGREISLNLPSAVSPSILGEWPLATLHLRRQLLGKSYQSRGQNEGGGSGRRAEPPCLRKVACLS